MTNATFGSSTVEFRDFQLGPHGRQPDRPTTILIHGSGGSTLSWYAQKGPLGQKVNVVAVDLPGHGRNMAPLLSTVAEMAAWLGELMVVQAFPRPVALVGHSLGGAVALEIALTRPELVDGLVLVGTGANLPVNPAIIDGLTRDFSGTIGLIMKWCYAKTSDPALAEAAIRSVSSNAPQVLVNDFTACDRFDRRQDLSRVATSTLVVCGRQDKMTPPALAEILTSGIPGSRLELIDAAGHQVMEEQSERFNQVVLDLVLGLARPATA